MHGQDNVLSAFYRGYHPRRVIAKFSDRNIHLWHSVAQSPWLTLAKLFAADGYDLIVAAENDDIATVAESLRESGVEADTVQVDLAAETGVDERYRRLPRRHA